MYEPQEQAAEVLERRRSISIGLPKAEGPGASYCPLTPEGASMLCERGFTVLVESGAAAGIHFSDEDYRSRGVKVVSRQEALLADIVVHLPPLSAGDARHMRQGAVLLGWLQPERQTADTIKVLLQRRIIAIALDMVADSGGHLPFADTCREVDGRAAVVVAAAMLADPIGGKGILPGGVAGINPCEFTILGSGIAAIAAAQSACGLGAIVKLFDDDVYSLRRAMHTLSGCAATGSVLHPRVFESALRTADVLIATPTRRAMTLTDDAVAQTKRGVIAFDLTGAEGHLLGGLESVDLAGVGLLGPGPHTRLRTCYTNPAGAVPRTAAMAMSSALLTFFDDIKVCDGLTNALRFNRGISRAAYTFLGKVVNADIARRLGLRSLDINLFLQF